MIMDASGLVSPLELKDPTEITQLSVTKEPIDANFAAKSLEFIANNKYKLLILAAISYRIYDHYHENHIGKSAKIIKDGLFSLWQKAITPSTTQETEQAKNQENNNHNQFVGPY